MIVLYRPIKLYPLLSNLENSAKKIHALLSLKLCFYNSIETELTRAVDIMVGQPKRIYILMIKANRLLSLFRLGIF